MAQSPFLISSIRNAVLEIAFRMLDIEPDHEMAQQAVQESYRALGRKIEKVAGDLVEQS